MTRRRSILPGAAIAALGLALAACGGGEPPPTIEVTATEFAFDPEMITVDAGQAFTLSFVNGGTIEHDFTIDELDISVLAPVTETVEEEIGPLEAGEYAVYCSIPGHREAGMNGTLRAEEPE